MQKSLLSAEIQFLLRKKSSSEAVPGSEPRAGPCSARCWGGTEPGRGARGCPGVGQPSLEQDELVPTQVGGIWGQNWGSAPLSSLPKCLRPSGCVCAHWRGFGGTWGPIPRAAVEIWGSPPARCAPDPAGELCLGFATSKALRGLSGRIREGRRGPGGEGRSRLQAALPEVAFQQMEERSRRCSRCCLRRM